VTRDTVRLKTKLSIFKTKPQQKLNKTATKQQQKRSKNKTSKLELNNVTFILICSHENGSQFL
jgi:hypothetical protein